SKSDLFIVDDFGLVNLDLQQRLDLMEIIEDRHAKASTIIASQLPVASWYDVIGEDTIADAILDRLIHGSYRIELKGESLRKKSNIVRSSVGLKENSKEGSTSPLYPQIQHIDLKARQIKAIGPTAKIGDRFVPICDELYELITGIIRNIQTERLIFKCIIIINQKI
ncbi:MAG: ATP-binding protein, partial [Sphingobacterium sp.]